MMRMMAAATAAAAGRARTTSASAPQSAAASIGPFLETARSTCGGDARAAERDSHGGGRRKHAAAAAAAAAEEEQLGRTAADTAAVRSLASALDSRPLPRIWPGRGRGRWQFMSTAAVEASAEPSTADGIVITDSCIRRLKELQTEDGAAGQNMMLRLSVDGGGCSGFLYNFTLDDKNNSDDRLFKKGGVTVVVDEISLSFVKGSTIDFSEELIRASFTVASNPNAASGCGCGASFTAK